MRLIDSRLMSYTKCLAMSAWTGPLPSRELLMGAFVPVARLEGYVLFTLKLCFTSVEKRLCDERSR
jgi:hypothetical protein